MAPTLESIIQGILSRARACAPGEACPPPRDDAAPLSAEAPAAGPRDQVCSAAPDAPGSGITAPGISLFAPPQVSADASPVDQALAHAVQAKQSNDRSQFAFWGQRAVAEARQIPNGDVVAAPMVEADLMAIDGRFLEASQGYRALEATLAVAAQRDPSLQSAIDTVKQRHKGILAAGAATAVVSYAQARTDGNFVGMNQAQRLATGCADDIYRLEPTERNLQMTLATYAHVGLDIRELRRQVALNESRISNLELGQVNPQLDVSGESGAAAPSAGPFFPGRPVVGSTVEQLRDFNQWANGVIARTEAHVTGMVGTAQADAPYTAAIQRSTALTLMGNDRDALVELRQARTLFTFGRVPRTPENLATEITVLHRLVGLSGISYDYHEEVLTEARGLITGLGNQDRNQAALFTVENMELTGTLRANRMARRLSAPGLSDDDKEAMARDYQTAVRQRQMEIVRYCEASLGRITDRPTREAIGDRMFGARAAVLEQDLGAALVRYQKDEKREARADAQTAIRDFQAFAAAHQDVSSAAGYREGMGRAALAQAHFDFRTGRIEEAISTLRGITDGYSDSSAARIVRGQGGWPRQYGIVDGRGEFRDTNQANVLAAIRTGAAQLNREQGRGLAMCGVGAGIFIAADIAVGEKVSGAAVLAGCAAAYTLDRAVLVAQASNEIAAAYRTGVSNVTTEEAVFSAGMFALNLASMYVGGAAGGLAERAVIAGGSRIGAELTPFLISKGFTPGPWTRVIGGFALRETAYVANSAAFHVVSSRANHAGATAWSTIFGREAPGAQRDTGRDYLVSWLFVRVMPMVMQRNPAGRLIPGQGRFDVMARTGVNTGIGLGAVQVGQALLTRDPSQLSLDRLGGMGLDFLMMHHGNRAMESVLPMRSVRDWSARLDASTLRDMRRIRDDMRQAVLSPALILMGADGSGAPIPVTEGVRPVDGRPLASREPGFIQESLAWRARNGGSPAERTWTQVTAGEGQVGIEYIQGGQSHELSIPVVEARMQESISTTGDSYTRVTLPDGTSALSFEPLAGSGSVWDAALLLNHAATATPGGSMLPRVLGIHMHNGRPRLLLEAFPTRIDQVGIRRWSDLSPAQQAQLASSLHPDLLNELRGSQLNTGHVEADYLFVGADGRIRMGLPRRMSSFADEVYGGRIFAPRAAEAPQGIGPSQFESNPYIMERFGVPEGTNLGRFVQDSLRPVATEAEMRAVRSLLLAEGPAAASDAATIRAEVASRLRGGEGDADLGRIIRTVEEVVVARHPELAGVFRGPLFIRALEANVSGRIDGNALAGVDSSLKILRAASLQFLPDDIPLYRAVSADAVRTGADGGVSMAPNAHGMSFWGVGEAGRGVAEDYGRSVTTGEEIVLLRTTVGDLRRSGLFTVDAVARTGNALDLHHSRAGAAADSAWTRIPVERMAQPPASPSTVAVPSSPTETFGGDAIRFLADRGGVGFMAGNPEQVTQTFRTEFGDDNFRRIEFLFSDSDVSRARLTSLRTRIAERAGHRYESYDETRRIVDDVLREEGVDLSAWAAEGRRRHEAAGDNYGLQRAESMRTDVLEGVLMVQLLPDEIPLYRATVYAGQSGENGSSWWGVGEEGRSVAANYVADGRIFTQSTVGDLRRSGVVRFDDVAVTGNALELYHRTAEGATAAWVPVRYEAVSTPLIAFSLDRLNPEHRRDVESCLGGRDPASLSFVDQRAIVDRLSGEFTWSRNDVESLIGSDGARILYRPATGIDLSFLTAP